MNAKTDDLWAVLSEGSGQPVNELMDSWTKQKGYPVIHVKVGENTLELEQVCLSLSLFMHHCIYCQQVLAIQMLLKRGHHISSLHHF